MKRLAEPKVEFIELSVDVIATSGCGVNCPSDSGCGFNCTDDGESCPQHGGN